MPVRPEWQPARLAGTRDLTHDIRLFEIEAERFEAPAPGSHLKIAVEIAGRPDVRSYSIVGAAPGGRYQIAVKRLPDSRGGSVAMWRLKPGARLEVAGPHNHFQLTRNAPGYLLVAGGIGVTPIHSMAAALADRGAPVRMVYACRGETDFAFGTELAGMLGERLSTHFDERGERIDLAAEFAALHPDGEAYVCGPMGMLEAAKRIWASAGRPAEKLRFETFGNSGLHAAEPFRIRIPRLDRIVSVRRNETMLEALEAAGIAMIADCRRGECGLCALDIIEAEGTVDHRDVFFSDAQKKENRKLCTCVSRMVNGDVVLDTPDRVR